MVLTAILMMQTMPLIRRRCKNPGAACSV